MALHFMDTHVLALGKEKLRHETSCKAAFPGGVCTFTFTNFLVPMLGSVFHLIVNRKERDKRILKKSRR